MEIQFKTHALQNEISPKVTALAQRKLIALKKYLKEGPDDTILTHVYVELGKDSGAHQQGNIWFAQINLDRNGKRYTARANAEKIEISVDKAVHELERELQKAKQLRESLIKRGGVALKSMLRGYKLN